MSRCRVVGARGASESGGDLRVEELALVRAKDRLLRHSRDWPMQRHSHAVWRPNHPWIRGGGDGEGAAGVAASHEEKEGQKGQGDL